MILKRLLYPDFLRVIAIFAVIVIHVVANEFYAFKPNTYEWQVFNFYDGLVRWCVPVFIMVSGMFLLDFRRYSENVSENFNRILKKNIFRICIVLIFWSIFYLCFDMFLNDDFNFDITKLSTFLFKSTKYHLWFLYLIIGLYFITPFLQVLVRNLNKKDFELLLIVLAISCCAYDFINVILSFFLNKTLYIRSQIPELSGYLIYFLAGYYFANFEISKKSRIIFYILAIFGLIFTIYANSLFSMYHESKKDFFYAYKLINTMFVSFGIFIWVKNLFINLKNTSKFTKIITKLSSLSFGIYLVHVAILDIIFKSFEITAHVVMIPLLSIVVFIISASLAFIISKIPILQKVI